MATSPALRRTGAVALIAALWVVTAFGSLAAALSAYLGRANWGDGQPTDPMALTVLLAAAATFAPLAAAWVTRWAWRHLASTTS